MGWIDIRNLLGLMLHASSLTTIAELVKYVITTVPYSRLWHSGYDVLDRARSLFKVAPIHYRDGEILPYHHYPRETSLDHLNRHHLSEPKVS